MAMLFKATRGCEGLPAIWTCVAPGPHMLGPYMSLKIGGVSEVFFAMFARKPSAIVCTNLQ